MGLYFFNEVLFFVVYSCSAFANFHSSGNIILRSDLIIINQFYEGLAVTVLASRNIFVFILSGPVALLTFDNLFVKC